MLDAITNPKGMGKDMKKKMKAPFRVGVNNKVLAAKFIERNLAVVTDMMWQGLKFIIEEIRSDKPYGDGSPTNKAFRQYFLTESLNNGFVTFYRIVGHNENDAKRLANNAMTIIKDSAKESVSDINTKLLKENWFQAEKILKSQKEG